ncbi:MAG: nascent polypeptide-associated complex protein [bacterium]|nr:nascent polypeptide-associated complex protein [bacterium]
MIPGMDPRAMKAAMKKMGMKQEEVEASEVIIRTPDKDLIITEPNVMKVDMMGQESFQITGTVTEQSSISAEDIKTVAEQAGVSEEKAREAIEAAEGDLAAAIMGLK